MKRILNLTLASAAFFALTSCGQDMTVLRDGICNNNNQQQRPFNAKFLPTPVDPDCTAFRQ